MRKIRSISDTILDVNEVMNEMDLDINTIYAEPLVSIITSLKESHIEDFSIKLNKLHILKEETEEDVQEDMKLNFTTHTYHTSNKRVVNCVAYYTFMSNGDTHQKVTVNIDVSCTGNYVLPELDKYLHKYCYTYIVGILKLEKKITSMYVNSELPIPESLDVFEKSDIKKYNGYSEVFTINSEDSIKIDDSDNIAFFDKTTKQI